MLVELWDVNPSTGPVDEWVSVVGAAKGSIQNLLDRPSMAFGVTSKQSVIDHPISQLIITASVVTALGLSFVMHFANIQASPMCCSTTVAQIFWNI